MCVCVVLTADVHLAEEINHSNKAEEDDESEGRVSPSHGHTHAHTHLHAFKDYQIGENVITFSDVSSNSSESNNRRP